MRILKKVLALAIDILVIEDRKIVLAIFEYAEAEKKAKKIISGINTAHNITTVLLKNLIYSKDVLDFMVSGTSLKHNKALLDFFTATKKIIVTYSLENLDHVKKTLFGYALKGRGKGTGFLQSLEGEPLGRNNIILPAKHHEELQQFMKYWKVEYTLKSIIEVEE